MTTLTIDLGSIDTDAAAPLYHMYPGQHRPQRAYIELDEDGVVSAGVNGEIGNGVPERVWHNRTLRWTVNSYLTMYELRRLIDRVLPLLELVHEGHEVRWDGNNHRGRLTDGAQDASDSIDDICSYTEGTAEVDDEEG